MGPLREAGLYVKMLAKPTLWSADDGIAILML
jgi:hypothetical protein